MKKHPLSAEDKSLVTAAVKTAKMPLLHYSGKHAPPLVAAALRLNNGEIITSTNLFADVGSLSLCAEPFAIAEAAKRKDLKIASIVAVYHRPGHEPKVVPPCGRCREIITDYAKDAYVVLREPAGKKLFRVKSGDLLPLKYADYWRQNELL
jgi:cytidine deaminase